jgi:serine/threonine protein kinase
VVRVLGVHHLASGPRLMIEQVPGRTLEALIDAAFPERLPLPEILAVVRDCTRGLHFLHELRDQRGTAVRLVHGTMAPPLVAVGFDGVARVAGLERLCATRGAPRPDPRFAAPEQSQEGAAVDRRADVFALAAVLLRAATGLQLRDGLVPVPTSQAIPYVPQSIEDVLRKALAPDPAKRFATAEDLRAAIERCVVNEGLAAGPDRVSLMVSRYLPDVPVAPAPSQLPPRPDQSLWGPGGAAAQSNWMPVESVLDTSEPSSASGFDAISVQVPRPAMRPSQPPAPNPLVPSAAAGQRTMTVAALDEATEIAQVPLPRR